MVSTIFINSTVLPFSSRVLLVEALTHFGKLFINLSLEKACLTIDIYILQ